MQDPYGNYVVQYVLQRTTPVEAEQLVSQVLQSHMVFPLSKQKFSSNVMEKCLQLAPPRMRSALIDTLASDSCGIKELLLDNYGNYVVQRALVAGSDNDALALARAIQPHLPSIQGTSCARRVISKILRRFPNFLSMS